MLVIDPRSAVPPFEQVRAQIVELVRTGGLQADARLPTVRKLAADLGIAPGTVMRAYSELEAAGYILTRRGAGTIVNDRPPRSRPATRLNVLAESFVDQARLAGASSEEILAIIQHLLQHR